MAYRAVVFDLFGTLVGNFSVQEYDRVLRRMAEALSTPYAEFCQHAGRNYYQREIGQFASLEESLASLCREQLQVEVNHALVEQLAQYHYEYVTNILVPGTRRVGDAPCLEEPWSQDRFNEQLWSRCATPLAGCSSINTD